MLVLVTRPAADSAGTAARLQAAGFETLVAPLMTIEPRTVGADVNQVLADAVGVLVTSANGVRALAAAASQRDMAVYAVGAASAAAARDLGFAAVTAADGDVAALATLVRDRVDAGAGRLVHVAGSVTVGGDGDDLAARLGRLGYGVDRLVLYDAAPVAALPSAAVAALRDGRVDGVALYSPRSAKLFVELVVRAGQGRACRQVVAACLSAAVGRALDGLMFANIVVAAGPTESQLIAALTSALKDGPQHATS